jgi:hypothetical protein
MYNITIVAHLLRLYSAHRTIRLAEKSVLGILFFSLFFTTNFIRYVFCSDKALASYA